MAELLLYGVIGDTWDGLDAQTVVQAISATDGNLDVRINSPGGFVMEGVAIYNALIKAKADGRKVTCYIDGLAASMASVIAMAGDEIIMADAALMMVHNPWDCACGDATELRKAADQLDRLRDIIVGIYAKQTGLAPDALITLMDAETWLMPSDALAQNFITSIGEALTVSASNVKPFGFRKAPDSPLITAMAMARSTLTAPPVVSKKDDPNMPKIGTTAADANTVDENPILKTGDAGPEILAIQGAVAAAGAPPAKAVYDPRDQQAAVDTAVAAERTRVSSIRALGDKHKLDAAFVDGMINSAMPLAEAREKILDKLADGTDAHNAGGPSITITHDARAKWIEGATNWLLIRHGQKAAVENAAKARGETVRLDAGEFRGTTPVDLAREYLQMANIRVNTRDPSALVGAAFTARNTVTQGTGDFAVLLENVMHKTLQSAYLITPDTWSMFCGKGTVTDFRVFNRYLKGTFTSLDSLNELGEFKNKGIPDGEKATIQAATRGNIVALSRQAIINDDMGVFISLASDLGRAAKLTIEKDVYALLVSNPVMADGIALFHASHFNLAGSGSASGVAAFDAARVAMASQKDVSGNEYLDIRPAVWLGPLSKEGAARVVIGSPYDPDATNKLQRPNIVQSLVKDIVGTPRLSGTQWYFFADKDAHPAIEVAFLNGVEEPFLDNELGWRVDGTEWKVRLDYGIAAINYRSAYADPGA